MDGALQLADKGRAPVFIIGATGPWTATEQQLLHLYGSLLGVAPGAVGVDSRWKVGFSR
jgi:hypothetical protein